MVAFYPWDHLGRRVTPMLAVYAAATVVVTVTRETVRLVWVNGSFGCRTIAARTRDLIPDTMVAVTSTYSTIPVLPWDCSGQPDPQTSLKCEV